MDWESPTTAINCVHIGVDGFEEFLGVGEPHGLGRLQEVRSDDGGHHYILLTFVDLTILEGQAEEEEGEGMGHNTTLLHSWVVPSGGCRST